MCRFSLGGWIEPAAPKFVVRAFGDGLPLLQARSSPRQQQARNVGDGLAVQMFVALRGGETIRGYLPSKTGRKQHWRPYVRCVTSRNGNARARSTAASASRNRTCDCAWTGCITVPNAARHATSGWLIPMSAETSCIELLVPGDDRLLAAVDTALLHACERAGLSSPECSELSGAVSEICGETFGIASRNGNRDTRLHLLIHDFEGRVEVSVERADGGPVAPAATGSETVSQQLKVDGLNRDVRGGRPRTVLVKQHHATTRR